MEDNELILEGALQHANFFLEERVVPIPTFLKEPCIVVIFALLLIN